MDELMLSTANLLRGRVMNDGISRYRVLLTRLCAILFRPYPVLSSLPGSRGKLIFCKLKPISHSNEQPFIGYNKMREQQMEMEKEMGKISILIIEDDEHHAFLEQEALCEKLDCRTQIVRSKTELTEEDIKLSDIILLDFNLPDATGAEILADIRRCSEVPVIIVTGNESLQIAIETMKQGATEFLVKSPKNISLLPHVVRKNLEKYKEDLSLKIEIKKNEELHIKIKTLKQVLTTLSHYINNSTTTIFGYAQLCDQDNLDEKRAKKLVRVSIRETQKITFVLQELENFINTMQIETTDYVNIPDAMFKIEQNIQEKMKKLP